MNNIPMDIEMDPLCSYGAYQNYQPSAPYTQDTYNTCDYQNTYDKQNNDSRNTNIGIKSNNNSNIGIERHNNVNIGMNNANLNIENHDEKTGITDHSNANIGNKSQNNTNIGSESENKANISTGSQNDGINGTKSHSVTENNENNSSDNKEDIKPDIKKKVRGRKSNYWNKKVDKNFPFYGCAVCNVSFMEIYQLDQHVVIHTNRITSYDLRQINKKKRKKLKKEKKKIKKEAKVKQEIDVEIKPEDGYIGNEIANEYNKNTGNNNQEIGNSDQEIGNNGQNHGNSDQGNNKNGKDNVNSYIKVYKCFACNKEFALSYYLKIHVRSHTDDKPYVCKVCNQSFITASKLGRHHKRTHVESSRKQCRICFKPFSRFDLLVAHFDKLHAEDKLEGEPYDYNAILPYLQELEDQLKNEDEKEVKPKIEDSFPVEDNQIQVPIEVIMKEENIREEKVLLPECDIDEKAGDAGEPLISIEQVKVKEEIDVCEPPDDEPRDDDPIDDDCDDIKNEDSSDSDYFPEDSWAAAVSPAPEAGGSARAPRADCPLCHKTFSSKSYLTVHMRTHTGEKPFKCYQCGRGFITANKMHRHVLTHEETWNGEDAVRPEGATIKAECYTDDDKSNDLKEKIAKSKEKLLKKSKGNKKTKRYAKRPHVCEFCHKKFLHVETLQIHRKSHDGEELVYKCNFCLEPQLDAQALKEHEATHTGPRPYLCTECGKTYMKKESMVYHKKNHKPDDASRSVICDICSKRLPSARQLQRHMVSHTTDRFVLRYECPVCAHMFHTKYHTAMHLSTHMKEGLILEENRNAVLAMVLQNARKIPVASNSNVKMPETMPTDERSRICNICGQIFQHFFYLEEHLKTHASKIAVDDFNKEENKKYQCQICSKSFKLHYYLKLHSYTHSNEKPFICQQCGKGFITKGKLKRHLETHQGIKKYQCHICYKFFTRPSYLRIHVRTIHGTQDFHMRDYSLGVPLNNLPISDQL